MRDAHLVRGQIELDITAHAYKAPHSGGPTCGDATQAARKDFDKAPLRKSF